MYKSRIIVASVVCAALVSGCVGLTNPLGLNNDISSDLYVSSVANQIKRREFYMGQLCKIAQVADTATVPHCPKTLDSTAWTRVLSAGMIDVDQRCSAYLDWLYDVGKEINAKRAELNSLSVLTVGLIGAYAAGSKALAAVALAFGFAQEQLLIEKSRYLLDTGHTAVQRIVIAQQNIFRKILLKTLELGVVDQFHVENILRKYLEVCLPRRIEANIRTIAPLMNEVIAAGSKPDEALRVITSAMITDRQVFVSAGIPQDPRTDILKRVSKLQRDLEAQSKRTAAEIRKLKFIGGPISMFEKTILRAVGRNIQKGLCLAENAEFGLIGSPTRLAIETSRVVAGKAFKDGKPLPQHLLRTINNLKEINTIKSGGGCPGPRMWGNVFEKFAYGSERKIKNLQKAMTAMFKGDKDLHGKDPDIKALRKKVGVSDFMTGVFDPPTRDAIAFIRKIKKHSDGKLIDQKTFEILRRLGAEFPPT